MSDDAYKVMLELLNTYTTENASQAREDAQRCIVASLADPNIYLLDHLLPLNPVKFLEGNPIHDLLLIAVYEGLQEYLKFYSGHKEFLQKMSKLAVQKAHRLYVIDKVLRMFTSWAFMPAV